jgi:hypothetical protein
MLWFLRHWRSGLAALVVFGVLGCSATPTTAPNKSNAPSEKEKAKPKPPDADVG